MERGCSSPWVPVWDDTHKAYYYHNTVTDETSWVLPPGEAEVTSKAAASSDAADGNAGVDSSQPSSDRRHRRSVSPEAGEPDTRSPADSSEAIATQTPDAGRGTPVPTITAVDDSTGSSTPVEESSGSSQDPAAQAEASLQDPPVAAPAPAPAPVQASVEDLRPSTLVWWSDAGDVWDAAALSGLLAGYGRRQYRNLGGGYYMTTLEMGPEWAAAAAAALGQGEDAVSQARVDWVPCRASAPGYGLFLRWAGDDDEQKLFDVIAEVSDDPPPDPAVVAAAEKAAAEKAAAEAAMTAARAAEAEAAEAAEAEAEAEAAVAATEQAEASGASSAAAAVTSVGKVIAAAAVPSVSVSSAPVPTRRDRQAGEATSGASTKKRKSSKGLTGSGVSGISATSGASGKKRKNTASLIDKWNAVASTAGEEAEREAEKQERLERWKARAAAQDPDNPNFMPLGRRHL